MIRFLKRHRHTLLVVGMYALLTIGMTYPVVGQMSTHLVGDSTDAYLFVWGNWWTREALRTGADVYHTDYIFYPSGVSLYFHAFSHINALFWMPLATLMGNIRAYNLLILMTYWLASFNMYLLARNLGLSGAAAFVAGLIYGFSPYHLSKADNLILCSTQWIPLFVLFFLRGVRKGSLYSGVFAAIFIALSALTNWHFLMSLGLWTALFLLYSVVFERRMWTRQAVHSLLAVIVCSGLLLAPFLFPLVREQLTASKQPYVSLSEGQGNDLLAFFVPGPGHPLWGKLLHSLHARLQMLPGKGRRPPAYLGLTTLGLAVLAGLKNRRQAGFWLVAGIVFAVLSLHSPVTVGGFVLDGLRLPWFRPIVSLLRATWRFNNLFTLCFAVPAAFGWDVMRERLKAGRFASSSTWATAALCVLLLFAYAKLPFPTIEIHVSPFYHRLAQEEGDFGIVTVPMGYAQAKRYMFFQTYHGKKLVGGHVSRLPKGAKDFIDMVPILDAMEQGDSPPDRATFGIREQMEELAAHNVRYVILQTDQLSEEALSAWKAYLIGPPVYENPVVYDTASSFAPRWQISDDLMILDAEWSPGAISQAGWGELAVTWLADRPPGRDLDVQVLLVDDEGRVTQREAFRIGDEDWPTSRWPAGAAAAYAYSIQIGPFIPPGEYAIVLALVDSATGQTHGEAVTVGRIDVAALSRAFVAPAMMHALSVDFGEDLALLGYDVEQSDAALRLTLHWQAQRRMDVLYKFFVHVRHVESDVLVAQADIVSRNWTYPTIWWEAGEVVSDEIVLPLDGVASGEYRLVVGVYDSVTGERLPVDDVEGLVVSSDALVLQEIVRE